MQAEAGFLVRYLAGDIITSYILVSEVYDNLVDAAPNCSTEASRKTVTELAARLLAEFQTAFPGLTLKRSPVWEEHPDILGTQVVPLPSTNPA